MMMKLSFLSLRRYDLPHAIWAADYILKHKPKAVALEMPSTYQHLFDSYLKGKISFRKLKSEFEKSFGKKIKIDTKLIEKINKGKIDLEELKALKQEGAVLHIVMACKKSKTKLYLIDKPLKYFREAVKKKIISWKKDAAIRRAEASFVNPDAGLVAFSEFIHGPFHFFEMIIGHNEGDPFKHPTNCPICHMGVAWERFWHALYAHFTNYVYPVPESKYVAALHHYDRLREKEMIKNIMLILAKEKDVLVITHIWHTKALLNFFKKSKKIRVRLV